MKNSNMHPLVALFQGLLGSAAWFYVLGTVFTHPATLEHLGAPLAFAVVGSAVLSGFWSLMSSVPAHLVALYYSLPFIGWMIFQSISGGDLKSSLFWLTVAVGIYICGLAGSVSAHAMKQWKQPNQSEL
ncbi:MAG: hypothetical protein AB8C13_11080 [Phycisphaerales bacterium]